jgi:hypothetical protein
MLISSKPTAATTYAVNLPEFGSDYWYARQEIREAATIPTSTANAGVFRQVVKYDVTSIVRSYSNIIDNARAAVLLLMKASTQTSFYVSTGGHVYDCALDIECAPRAGKSFASVTFRVLSQVS